MTTTPPGALRRLLHRRFVTIGFVGAAAITMTWWLMVARGLWLVFEWAAA